MKFSTFDLMRVWAALTGIALAVLYFVLLSMGLAVPEALPMIVAGIGGFEMFLFAQDLWLKRGGQHG